MINTFAKALKVQTNRFYLGKEFPAKAVKRFLKKNYLTAKEFRQLGNVIITPDGFKRYSGFGPSPTNPNLFEKEKQ